MKIVMLKRLLYCPTCRTNYETFNQSEAHSVIHKTDSDLHLHPITREVI